MRHQVFFVRIWNRDALIDLRERLTMQAPDMIADAVSYGEISASKAGREQRAVSKLATELRRLEERTG